MGRSSGMPHLRYAAWVTMRALLLFWDQVAVMPAWHGQGIGTALIKAGFAFVAKAGISRVVVLGDPAYYQRFGFAPDQDIDTPYLIPDEWADAWQSVRLLQEVQPSQGVLHVPEPRLDPALWAP
jgi:putative acetyltransferase